MPALGIEVKILRQFLLAQIATESPYNAQKSILLKSLLI
jgi:hypothetical protein